MPLPDLVLVHGGEHAANCWDLVVAELRCQAPELRTNLIISHPERLAPVLIDRCRLYTT